MLHSLHFEIGPTNDMLQGLTYSMVKAVGSLANITGRTSVESEGHLGKGEARSLQCFFLFGVPYNPASYWEHFQHLYEDSLQKEGGRGCSRAAKELGALMSNGYLVAVERMRCPPLLECTYSTDIVYFCPGRTVNVKGRYKILS